MARVAVNAIAKASRTAWRTSKESATEGRRVQNGRLVGATTNAIAEPPDGASLQNGDAYGLAGPRAQMGEHTCDSRLRFLTMPSDAFTVQRSRQSLVGVWRGAGVAACAS